MKLINADIVMSTTKSFISRAIRFVLRRKNDIAPFSHIAGISAALGIVEARHKVVALSYKLFAKKNKKHLIARRKDLTAAQRNAIAQEVMGKIGTSYGYMKVGILQPLDQLFGTNFFTKNLSVSKKVYCSQLWAHAYFNHANIKINGVNPESCEPDDFHDEITKNPDKWEILYS